MLYRFIFFGSFSVLLYGIQLFWKSPLSPMFPHEVRNLIAAGDVEYAVDLLEWRAENTWSHKIRSDALWEAAQIVFLRLKDKERAKRCMLPSLLVRLAPYLTSPLILQPKWAS